MVPLFWDMLNTRGYLFAIAKDGLAERRQPTFILQPVDNSRYPRRCVMEVRLRDAESRRIKGSFDCAVVRFADDNFAQDDSAD